ncbi:MAG: macro domain-containing protein [Ignavibacteriota bacterium]|nr:Appr-1-p processing protein [Ignavibacteriota bacterium]MCO6448906.1 macro domain-containing protein [Ignavibacterium album]MCZ2267844.1 macro domain-containing protein [Ignavibacteriales bacterium]QKK00954.1 MAG: macro domain-containing protein [Ignavibacteriota bacterium]HOJ07772.1 macro domain-containing protein [Ignavibacteriaceae bacterium]
MSNITIIKGNLFTSQAQALVNTVNTVGVMGAGVALEFRLRYPDMNEKYVELCKQKQIQIGKLWIYKAADRWIINFPTKEDWKDDSKIEYLEKGLQKFVDTYKEKGITSVAFPVLGSRHGNIPENESIKVMESYLSRIDIPVEIYRYDPDLPDDLYESLKNKFLSMSIEEIKEKAQIQKQYAEKLLKILGDDKIKNISSLTSVEGIGIRTLEKVFDYLFNRVKETKLDENKEKLLALAKKHLKPETLKSFETYITKQKKISKSLSKIFESIIRNEK